MWHFARWLCLRLETFCGVRCTVLHFIRMWIKTLIKPCLHLYYLAVKPVLQQISKWYNTHTHTHTHTHNKHTDCPALNSNES
jgi:hypothetical protein